MISKQELYLFCSEVQRVCFVLSSLYETRSPFYFKWSVVFIENFWVNSLFVAHLILSAQGITWIFGAHHMCCPLGLIERMNIKLSYDFEECFLCREYNGNKCQ